MAITLNFHTMNHAIITTETSGLFRFNEPADAPGQPRLAAFGYQVLDEALNLVDQWYCEIQPHGWSMEPGATRVNGLTTEHLTEKGVPVDHALAEYEHLISQGLVLYGYNVEFDLKVMRGELRRSGSADHFEITKSVSMMLQARDVCGIIGASGQAKTPKLKEALEHFNLPWMPQFLIFEKLEILNRLHHCLGIEGAQCPPA